MRFLYQSGVLAEARTTGCGKEEAGRARGELQRGMVAYSPPAAAPLPPSPAQTHTILGNRFQSLRVRGDVYNLPPLPPMPQRAGSCFWGTFTGGSIFENRTSTPLKIKQECILLGRDSDRVISYSTVQEREAYGAQTPFRSTDVKS